MDLTLQWWKNGDNGEKSVSAICLFQLGGIKTFLSNYRTSGSSVSFKDVEWVHGLFTFTPCFRGSIDATCKFESLLCSLDTSLQKNVIVFLFWKSNFKMALIWKKRVIFDLIFTFFSHQGKFTKNLSSTYLTSIHTRILFTLVTLLTYQFWKKYEFIRYGFSLVWFLVLIPIRAILEQSINKKMVSNLSWNVHYWYVLTLMPN